MITFVFHCIKCGKPVTTSDTFYNKRWYCAPACEDCKKEVEKESRNPYRAWPAEWRGGWRWERRLWVSKERRLTIRENRSTLEST